MAVTRADLLAFTRVDLLNDPDIRIWQDTELVRYLQEGYDLLVTQTRALWIRDTPASLQDVINQGTYTLPTNLFELERMTYRLRLMEPGVSSEMISADRRFRLQTGEVYAYIMDGDGLRTLRKVRVPASNDGGELRTVAEYYRRGEALATAGTAIEIPDRYGKYISFYAAYKALDRDGDGQDQELAGYYAERFSDGQALLLQIRGKVRWARRGVFGTGRDGTRSGPPRPQRPWNFPNRGRRR